ncbi:uncharacterized protein LOC127882371 [Dreissena polymorpha]|nr:uncharacterized protein LOC127882371 [Dreissena polymorpha]
MFKLKAPTSSSVPGKKKLPPPTDETVAKRRKYEQQDKERVYQKCWEVGREWLVYISEKKVMKCQICSQYWDLEKRKSLRPEAIQWLEGTDILKKDSVVKHEKTKYHETAVLSGEKSVQEIHTSKAAEALKQLREADRTQMSYKFRNAHAVAKWDLSLKSYARLCELDQAKGLKMNNTYQNDMSAKHFIEYLAKDTLSFIRREVDKANYLSITVDGSSDAAGIEQESIYVHFARAGKVYQRFICFASPVTTASCDIYDTIVESLDSYLPGARDKLVGLTCDGASNMLGVHKGVGALLLKEKPGLVITHCLAHRLELAIKDVFKTNKTYDKAMTLLVGVFYWYKRSSKQQKELARTFKALNPKSVPLMPTRAGGTRWVSHMMKAINTFLRAYVPITTHLGHASNSNSKAEGLHKLATSMTIMVFLVVLKNILEPVSRMSKLLQDPTTTLGDVKHMKQSTLQSLSDLEVCQSDEEDVVRTIMESQTYKGVKLTQKGISPNSYQNALANSVSEEISARLSNDDDLLEASQIVNFKIWPSHDDRKAIQGFGRNHITELSKRFPAIDEEAVKVEFQLLKNLLYSRYGAQIKELHWEDAASVLNGHGVDQALDMVDLILSLPPTSVFNERSFSHMKLMKTDRRCRLKSSTMSDLCLVKLESAPVASFDPTSAIDLWATSSSRPRRPNFMRKKTKASTTVDEVSTDVDVPLDGARSIDTDSLSDDESDDDEDDDDVDDDENFENNENNIAKYCKELSESDVME